MDGVKHTPGPWFANYGVWPDQRRHWVDGGGYRVAQGPDVMPDEMAAANARLIAAAPDLLAACERLLASGDYRTQHGKMCPDEIEAEDAARVAIARARGSR